MRVFACLPQSNAGLVRERDSLERRLTLLCDGKTRDGKIIGEIDVSTWAVRSRQMIEHTGIVQSVCGCRGYIVSAGVDRCIKVCGVVYCADEVLVLFCCDYVLNTGASVLGAQEQLPLAVTPAH